MRSLVQGSNLRQFEICLSQYILPNMASNTFDYSASLLEQSLGLGRVVF